jgi:hypothetical protein
MIQTELEFAGRAVLLGAILIFAYDMLRILRRVIPHGNIWIGIEDMLYWVIFTIAVFLMMNNYDDGRIRGFALLGMAAGMTVYHIALSRIIVDVNVRIYRAILIVIIRMANIFIRPADKILRNRLLNFIKLFKMGVGKK